MYTIDVKVTDEAGNAPFSLNLPDLAPEEIIDPGMATPGINSVLAAIARAVSSQALLAVLLLFTAFAAFGQDVVAGPPDLGTAAILAPATPEPSMVLTLGVGGSTISDPRYGFTGAIGKRIASGTYATVAIDAGLTAAVDPATGKRKMITTMRPGLQKVVAKSGPFTLMIAGDAGGSITPTALVGQVSGGGSLVYDLPKHPGMFLYGALRIVKTPQADPALSNPAIVQSAFSVGFGVRMK